MNKRIVLTPNQRFGKLAVVKNIKTKEGLNGYLCVCDCGNKIITFASYLVRGKVKSCGCTRILFLKNVKPRLKHGYSRENQVTAEYTCYVHMKQRCYNKNDNRYYCYGARGIKMCKRWLNSFENFLQDMGERPSILHSIERKRINGHYTKSNCVWATKNEQKSNRTDTVRINIFGFKTHQKEFAKLLMVDQHTIIKYIKDGLSEKKIYIHFISKQIKTC